MLPNWPDSVVAVFTATRLSPPRPSVIEPEENGMTLNHPTHQVLSLTPVYTILSILYLDAKWQSLGRSTQARTQNRSRSFGLYPIMEGAVLKHERTIDGILGLAGPVIIELKIIKRPRNGGG